MPSLLAVLLFLTLGRFSGAECPPTNINQASSGPVLDWAQLNASQTCLNISGRNRSTISGQPGPGSPLKELDLSSNHLHSLPPGLLSNTEKLERLFLQHNNLSELPASFFENTPQLKRVRLEGNPLRSVPISISRLCLETLSVDCRCDVVGNIFSYCRELNCTWAISCHCLSNQSFVNITDFHAARCQGLSAATYAAIAVCVLVLLLGAAVGCALMHRKKRSVAVPEKRESSASNETQTRYISHGGPQGDSTQDPGGHADYENVFIGPSEEARGGHKEVQYSRKQPKSRSHRKVQEDLPPPGEQPIYANTQELYYNCVGTPVPLDEDLYVMPDQ